MKINMLQYAYEEFENIKGDNQNPLTEWRTVNTMSKRKNNKRTINDLQNTAQKTEDQATQTPLKTLGALKCSGG